MDTDGAGGRRTDGHAPRVKDMHAISVNQIRELHTVSHLLLDLCWVDFDLGLWVFHHLAQLPSRAELGRVYCSQLQNVARIWKNEQDGPH